MRHVSKTIAMLNAVMDHLRTNPKGKVLIVRPGGKSVVLKNRKVYGK